MKNFIISLFALAAVTASAGSFGSVTVTSTTNYINFTGVTNASAGITNTFVVTPPPVFISLTNVVNTNETFVGGVYIQVPQNLMTNYAGYSNLIYIGSVTQSFSGGLPAGGIWTTTTTPVSGSVAFPMIMQANNGIYTNGIFAQ